MTLKNWRAACAFALLGTAASCSFMQRQSFAQPEVFVTDVRLTGAGATGGKIDVLLSIYNPNNYRIDASQLHYRALVDSIKVGEGEIDQRVSLLKKDSAEVRIPVIFGYREALTVLQRFAQRGSLPFRIEGDIRFDTPFGGVTRAFVQTGSYDGMSISISPRKK